MKNNVKPFVTPNPQEFKLRIVWTVDGYSKMVAEFSSCKWLPRIGETLVLPIDEVDKSNSCHVWRKFKVIDIIYDFQHQVVRVLCTPIKLTPPSFPAAATEAMSRFREIESQFNAMVAEINEEDLDGELEKLKNEVLGEGGNQHINPR